MVKVEVSAGGVVYRKNEGRVEFLIGKHSGHHRWVLPKGWVEKDESKEQAAVREVKEEVGVEGELGEYLGEIVAYYTNDQKQPVRKSSHFFLMRYVSGDPENDHGWEMEEVRWVSGEVAQEELAYPGERGIVIKAAKAIP
jgi:8-oxo-dGTP diphosphatase